MKFNEYFRDLDQGEREHLAKRCETSVAYLYQIAGGHRIAGRELAERIERETKGKVSKVELVFGDAA